MRYGLVVFALLALLAVPALVSAEDATILPPEANWTSTPGVPPVVAVPQKRVVTTPQAKEMVSPSPAKRPATLLDAAFYNTGLVAIASDNDE